MSDVQLQWARANGCPWDKMQWQLAAATLTWCSGWLCANGCPPNEHACELAAGMGHLAVLQWLRANGCPSVG